MRRTRAAASCLSQTFSSEKGGTLQRHSRERDGLRAEVAVHLERTEVHAGDCSWPGDVRLRKAMCLPEERRWAVNLGVICVTGRPPLASISGESPEGIPRRKRETVAFAWTRRRRANISWSSIS